MASQLGEHLGTIAMVRDIVNHGGIDKQRDDPRRIGLERQLDQVVNQLGTANEFARIGDIFRCCDRHGRLRFVFPILGRVQSLLQIADRSEVLIHSGPIGRR